MSYQQAGQTENYYWERSLSNLLGQGICGTVYKGVDKATGESVAVKTFNDNALSRSIEVQARELDVIRRINHVNIVKLLAIEQENTERPRNVIVMELCSGGSLAKILEDPENNYGLDEDEFLLVLEHLTSGMKYLRENNIIHRDLKPGNIMKYIAEDGRSIYKLADFDAARELPEGQEFMSLYGTEEYLHPDMYQQALLPVGQQMKQFSESVDLWSIGVTLFHVATGTLPFKPFLLRKDRQTMHNITTKKEAGVISGYQLELNGPIYWRKTLPKGCLLSNALKDLITPMLAGLMEVNPRIRWDFTKFFAEAKNILERKRLHVFHVNKVKSLRVYLEPEKCFTDLQNAIREQTDILPENQTLLYKDSSLLSLVGDESGCAFPSTSALIPIICCDKENNNIKLEQGTPKLLFKLFPNTPDRFEDERIANYNCGVAYVYKRRIEGIRQELALINSAALTINQVVVSQLMAISKENLQIQSVMRSLSNQFEMMKGFHSSCHDFVQCIPASRKINGTVEPVAETLEGMGHAYQKQLENFLQLGDRLMKLRPSVCQLLGNRVENQSLMVDWEKKSQNLTGASNITRIGATANNFITRLRSSYEKLRVKHYQPMPRNGASLENEELLHLTERLLMRQMCKSLSILLRTEHEELEKLIENFSDWYKTAQIALIQPEILTKVLSQLRIELSACEGDLNIVVKEFQVKLKEFTDAFVKATTDGKIQPGQWESEHKLSKRKDGLKKLNEHLQAQVKLQEELLEQLNVNLEIFSHVPFEKIDLS